MDKGLTINKIFQSRTRPKKHIQLLSRRRKNAWWFRNN